MGGKSKVDWDKIEQDYCADVKSINQISRESGAAASTIRSRAKKFKWNRDLTSRIKMKADEIVNQNAIKNAVVTTQNTEEQTVDENARLTAAVRLSHRKDITRARNIVGVLFDDLEAMISSKGSDNLEMLFDMLVDEGLIDGDNYKAVAAWHRATGLSANVGNMQKLADTMTKLFSLERQAWNLDNLDDKTHDPLKTLLTTIANSNNNAFMVVADDPEYGSATANTIGVTDDD